MKPFFKSRKCFSILGYSPGTGSFPNVNNGKVRRSLRRGGPLKPHGMRACQALRLGAKALCPQGERHRLWPGPCTWFPWSQTGFPLCHRRLPDRDCLWGLRIDGFPDEKEQRKVQRLFFPYFFWKKPGKDGNIILWACQGHLAILSCTLYILVPAMNTERECERVKEVQEINANKARVRAEPQKQAQGTGAREGPQGS